MSARSLRAGACLAALPLLLAACRKSDSTGGAVDRPIVPNAVGANGCTAPDAPLDAAPVAVPLTVLTPGPMSQVTASTAGELLYATGADATVVRIDVTDPAAPQEQELVEPGVVASLYANFGLTDPPVLSGLAVLDANHLVVVEHTANVLLTVQTDAPNVVQHYAGQPSTTPGFADGAAAAGAGAARFSFDAPCQVCPTGGDVQELYVADSGNHAIRVVTQGQVLTIAGLGLPLYADGDISQAAFDTPSGLSGSCNDALYVTELGDFGFGQRVRRLTLTQNSPFSGSIGGNVGTTVGDGTNATTEGGTVLTPTLPTAEVSRPVSPLVSAGLQIYWIDSGTGVLRRVVSTEAGCPLAADCATAVSSGPHFTPGGLSTLTQTPSGTIYVLDAEAGTLYRIP